MPRVKINADSLDKLAAQMKAAPRQVRSGYRKGLKEIGNEIRDDAKRRIADKPETAKLLKTYTRMPATVGVRGGSKDHPVAKLLEGGGRPGYWKHPLFGNRHDWYKEKREPHLLPAFKAHQKDATKKIQRHVKDGLRAIDLKAEHD